MSFHTYTQLLMDPILSSFASGISATIKICEVVYQIQATDEQTSDILNTSNHVERNLKEAQRLFRIKADFIDRHDYEWAKSTMQDTRVALQGIAKLIEPARVAKITKKDIGIMTKTYWAFKYNPQARDKHAMLSVCHQTLMAVLTRLHSANPPTVPEIPSLEGPPPPPPPYDQSMEKLWAWRDHRNRRKNSITSLRNDLQRGPVVLATTQRQEIEGLSQGQASYPLANGMMDGRRSQLAQEIRTYSPGCHLNHRGHSSKPALSRNEISEFSPYHNGWTHGIPTNINLIRTESRLPCVNTASPCSFHMPHGPSPAAENSTSPVYEMSAAQTSPPERLLPSHLVTHELAAPPRFPIGDPMKILSSESLAENNDYGIGNSLHPPFPGPMTSSELTSPSWSSFVSADEPDHLSSTKGKESAEDLDFRLHPLEVLADRSELEAEGVQRGVAITKPEMSESPSMARVWPSAGCAWSNSTSGSTSIRTEIDDRIRGTGARNSSGLRGSWLAYQASLRGSRHGNEGDGTL